MTFTIKQAPGFNLNIQIICNAMMKNSYTLKKKRNIPNGKISK